MKIFSVAICFVMLSFMAGSALADDNADLLPVLKKMVADNKARFGIDVKKCRLECQRVYSEDHCISKCAQISKELKSEGFKREEEEKMRIEAEKPLKYKEAAEKYR